MLVRSNRKLARRPAGFVAALLCLVLTTGSAPAQELKLAHQFALDSLPDRVARKFSDLLAEKSSSLRVSIFPQAQLGDEQQNALQVRRGEIDLAIIGDLIVGELRPEFRIINMPFIYRSQEHAMRVYDSALGQEVRQQMASIGLNVLSWHCTGTRVLTANRPVRNLADIRGLRLRLPADRSWITVWGRLGAEPQIVAFSDLPAALRLGTLEAQENPPNFIRAGKLYEHQKFLMLTNHMPQRQFVIMANKTWTRLSATDRVLVQQAAQEASRWACGRARSESDADLRWLTNEGGMTLVNFDPRGITDLLRTLPGELGGAGGAKVYQAIMEMN